MDRELLYVNKMTLHYKLMLYVLILPVTFLPVSVPLLCL